MKPDYSKVFGRAIVVCWAVIIGCWVISLFAPELFLIVVENQRIIDAGVFIEGHTWALYLFAVCTSLVSMIPYWLACIGEKWFLEKYHLAICVVCTFIVTAVKVFNPIIGVILDLLWVCTTMPMLMGGTLKNCASIAGATIIYQFIVVFARSEIVDINAGSNVVSHFLINADYVIFVILLYLVMRGGEKNGLLFLLANGQGRISAKSYACRARTSNRSNRRKIGRVERKVNRQLMVRKVRSYAIVFGCMGVTAFFTAHVVEAFILFLAYLALRWTFPETFHARHPRNCTIISAVLFSVLIAFAVPVTTSLVSGVVVAVLLAYQLYREWDYRDIREGNMGRERDLRSRCNALGMSTVLTDIAVGKVVYKRNIKEQMEDTGLGESTVKNYRSQVNKILK